MKKSFGIQNLCTVRDPREIDGTPIRKSKKKVYWRFKHLLGCKKAANRTQLLMRNPDEREEESKLQGKKMQLC